MVRHLLIKIPILNFNANNQIMDDDDNEEEMQVSEDLNMERLLLGEILKMFDSSDFTNRIEQALNHFSRQQQDQNPLQLNSFCMSLAYISNFILSNSKAKTHQSL
jgi:hypothetical protein